MGAETIVQDSLSFDQGWQTPFGIFRYLVSMADGRRGLPNKRKQQTASIWSIQASSTRSGHAASIVSAPVRVTLNHGERAMFTFRRPAIPVPILQRKPRKAPAEVLAFVDRMRMLAARGDVELAELLQELAPYLPTEADAAAV